MRFERTGIAAAAALTAANRDLPCPTSVDIPTVSNHCSGVEQEPLMYNEIFSSLTGRPAANAGRRTAPIEVTVDDPETSPYPLWNENKTYEEGDKVVRRGDVFRAKWWTRGDDPDMPIINDWDTPWALVGPVLPTDRPSETTSAKKARP